MRLKDLLAPVMRLLGRGTMDATRKTARNSTDPRPKRSGGTEDKAARASVKKARQAARVTRRRG